MAQLNPTPADRLLDARGRPYFLWDSELTLDELRVRLVDSDADVRLYFVAKVLRQAKPDDALSFISLQAIEADWQRLEPRLGRAAPFWRWLLREWRALRDGRR